MSVNEEVLYGTCFVCGQEKVVYVIRTKISGDEFWMCGECREKRRRYDEVRRV